MWDRVRRMLLARATNSEQASRMGDQTGGRVFPFLYTDDFWRHYHAYKSQESYGMVAVVKDLYGNQWDLLQPRHLP